MKWKWWDLTCIIGRKDISLKKWQGNSASYSKIITDKVNAVFWVARQKNRCKTKSTINLSLEKFLCMDMHVSWTYPTLLGFPQYGFLPTSSCSFILDLFYWTQLLLSVCPWMWNHPLGCGQSANGYISPAKCYSRPNSYQLPRAPQLRARYLWPLPYSCWNFNWLYLVQVLYRWPQLQWVPACCSHSMPRGQHFTSLLLVLWILYSFWHLFHDILEKETFSFAFLLLSYITS